MKKACFCISLIIVIIFSSVYPVFAEDAPLSVMCVSDWSDNIIPLQLRIIDNALYIRVDDAALISGYQLSDDQKIPKFVCGGAKVEISSFVTDDVKMRWIPLEGSLEELGTSVRAIGGYLFARSTKSTGGELISAADEIMLKNNYKYRITTTDGLIGNTGFVMATIYNVLSSGSIYEAITGKYSYDLYRDMFSEILTYDDVDETLADRLTGYDKTLRKLSKVTMAHIGADSAEDVMKLYSYGAVDDTGAIISLYGEISDPIGSAIDISGFDWGSQLAIYSYLESITSVSDFNMNMLGYTLMSDQIYNKAGWAAGDLIYAATDVYGYYTSERAVDVFIEAVKQECNEIAHSQISAAFDVITGTELLNKAMGLQRIVLEETISASSKAKLVEKARCLSEIQGMALQFYRAFRNDKDTAINAKYAALLYLRCLQVHTKMFEDEIHFPQSYKDVISSAMASLAEFDDYDLTIKIDNPRISPESLHKNGTAQLEEITADIIGRWTYDDTTNNYRWTLVFENTGKISAHVGWLDSEIAAVYEGEYYIVESNGSEFTAAFDLVGGSYIENPNGTVELEQKPLNLVALINVDGDKLSVSFIDGEKSRVIAFDTVYIRQEPVVQKSEPSSSSSYFVKERWQPDIDCKSKIVGIKWDLGFVLRNADDPYDAGNLFGSGLRYGSVFLFNEDGTFEYYIGVTDNGFGSYTTNGFEIHLTYEGSPSDEHYAGETATLYYFNEVTHPLGEKSQAIRMEYMGWDSYKHKDWPFLIYFVK